MKVKAIYLILFIVGLSMKSSAQCNVKTINRPDGVTVKYMNPEMVGKGTGRELGVSISHNGLDYCFNTTVLFSTHPIKSTGTLMVELSDNQSLNLKLFASELAVIKNSEVSANVYLLTKTDIEKLKKTIIKKIIFKEEGGKNHIIILTKNFDVAARHINCLK
ncbi:MAG: hypothetical protein LC111_02095 [Bacteroidia bacterium]|nr:hypothetical protein [Bacteroidia bacterium]